MSLLHEIEQQLIMNHMKNPTPHTLFTRDAFEIAKRAIEAGDLASQEAALGAFTFSMAVMVAELVDPEVFIEQFLIKFRLDVEAMKKLAYDYIESAKPQDGDTIN